MAWGPDGSKVQALGNIRWETWPSDNMKPKASTHVFSLAGGPHVEAL